MTDREIERLLAATAAATRYPPTPALSARILARIEALPVRNGSRLALHPAVLVTAVAVAALVVLAAALVLRPSREAIADFFGVAGSTVERLPTPPAGLTPTPFPTAAATDALLTPASLAEVAEVAEVARAVGFDPALPEGDETPALAFVRYGDQAVAVLQYERFDLWEARIEQEASFGKSVTAEAVVRDVEVAGVPGRWLAGSPHIVAYYAADGHDYLPGSLRAVERNTLVWRTDHAFYRLETDLSLEEALPIAETLP